MNEFEFFFSFYGLLLGLSVAAVVSGLAEALSSRKTVTIGWLSPLLALFVLVDIASFWIFAFRARDAFRVDYPTMYLWLSVAIAYFLAAALVFPRQIESWPRLDDHYWTHKRIVVGGIAAANAIVVVHAMLTRGLDGPLERTVILQSVYWIPLAGLLFSRNARIDTLLLAWLSLQYVGGALLLNY